MPRRRRINLDLEDVINAIVARDKGMPYHTVLETYNLTPGQFYWHVGQLSFLAEAAKGNSKVILEQILESENRKAELFRMEESFIREQYALVMVSRSLRRRLQLPHGFIFHPMNIEILIYVAMTTDKPELASPDRGTVVQALSSIKKQNLTKHLRRLGLGGVMLGAFSNSYWEAFKVFDKAYQSRTGNASLLDLSQAEHVHPWDGNLSRSSGYSWNNSGCVEDVIFHVLLEQYPLHVQVLLKGLLAEGVFQTFVRQNPLINSNVQAAIVNGLRATFINGVKEIQSQELTMTFYLRSLGLAGLMNTALNDSSWQLLHAFDKAYHSRTGDTSLFDLSQPLHLHPWGDAAYAPQGYWLSRANIAQAVYHILREKHPKLGSPNESEIREGIRELPSNLDLYARQILPLGLYNELPSTRSALLRLFVMFDEGYQRVTGNASLFGTVLPAGKQPQA